MPRTKKPRAVSLFCFISVGKARTFYKLIPLPAVQGRGWRLKKKSGKTYDVWENSGRYSCTCGDCVYRGRRCKHILSLIAATLLPKPAEAGHGENIPNTANA